MSRSPLAITTSTGGPPAQGGSEEVPSPVLQPRRRLTLSQTASAPSSLAPKNRKTINIVVGEEDPVEGFSQSVVRDYLRRKGCEETLAKFDEELAEQGVVAPSVRCWYDMAAATRLNAAIERNHEPDRKEYECMLEILVRELVETADAREGGNVSTRLPILGGIEFSGGDDGAGGSGHVRRQASLKTDGFGGGGDYTPVGASGADSSAAKGGVLPDEPLAHIKLPDPRPPYDASKSSIPALRPPRPLPAATTEMTRDRRPRSVLDLNKEYQKHTLSPTGAAKPHRARRRAKARSKNGSPTSHSPTGGGGGVGGRGDEALVSSAELGPGEELTAAELASWERSRSVESWIPINTRLRMLRRGMETAKYNSMEVAKFQDMISKKAVKLDDLQRAKMRERYKGKKKKICNLCELPFAEVNLPMSISYKAIMDLRSSWGVQIPPNAILARAPRCYDEVRVCLFCSQLFEDADRYRPPPGQSGGRGRAGEPVDERTDDTQSYRRGRQHASIRRKPTVFVGWTPGKDVH